MQNHQWMMHIAAWYRGTPGPKFTNSGNKCPLAKPITIPNFLAQQQEVYEISAVENLCFRKSGPMFTQIRNDLLRTKCPLSWEISSRRPNDVQEKQYRTFYTVQYFGATKGPPGPKIHQCWSWLVCQISSISLMAKTVNDICIPCGNKKQNNMVEWI